MEIALGYFLKAFVLPPGINLFALAFAWTFLGRSPRMQRAIYLASVIALWLWSTPFIASWQARSLESYGPVDQNLVAGADAVVILGGGMISEAPELDIASTIRADTLERVRYGAIVARKYGLPIAVTGGSVSGEHSTSLGSLMAKSLRDDFGLEATWVEGKSRNTAQNARYLRDMVPAMRIVLVTHALHMPRSMRVFQNVGFVVIPAPIAYISGSSTTYGLFDFFPSAKALFVSHAALHEWLGLAYSAIRY